MENDTVLIHKDKYWIYSKQKINEPAQAPRGQEGL